MRYPLLDTIRGVAIISMVFYHAMWDLVFMFGLQAPWYNGPVGYIWQQSICWTFIILSGFCQRIAKHSLKDGLVVSLGGLLVTVVSLFISPGVEIFFGILTFIGLAMLITIPLKRFYNRVLPIVGMVVALCLFALTKKINLGYLGFGPFDFLNLPQSLYPIEPGWIQTLVGFTAKNFYSGDYFSLMPWYFLFVFGYFLCGYFEDHGLMRLLKGGKIPVLDFLGRHSLLIYLLHQPLLYLLFELIY